jgi:hypothetical protein
MRNIPPYQGNAQSHSFDSSYNSTGSQPPIQQQQYQYQFPDFTQQAYQTPQQTQSQVQQHRSPAPNTPWQQHGAQGDDQRDRIVEALSKLWQRSPHLQPYEDFFYKFGNQELDILERVIPLLRQLRGIPQNLTRQCIPDITSSALLQHLVPHQYHENQTATSSRVPETPKQASDRKHDRSESTDDSDGTDRTDESATNQKASRKRLRKSSTKVASKSQSRKIYWCPFTTHGDCKHGHFTKLGNLTNHVRNQHTRLVQGLKNWEAHLEEPEFDFWSPRLKQEARSMTPQNTNLLQTGAACQGPTTPMRNAHFDMRSPAQQTQSPNLEMPLNQFNNNTYAPGYYGMTSVEPTNSWSFFHVPDTTAAMGYRGDRRQSNHGMPHGSSDMGSNQDDFNFHVPSN